MILPTTLTKTLRCFRRRVQVEPLAGLMELRLAHMHPGSARDLRCVSRFLPRCLSALEGKCRICGSESTAAVTLSFLFSV